MDGFSSVNVVAHHGNELDAHAQPLKVPNVKLVPPHLSGLQILKEAVVLLCRHLPPLKAGAKGIILRLHDGRLVQDMVRLAANRQPAVFLVVGRAPIAGVDIARPAPRGQRRRPPVDLVPGLGGGIFAVGFGKVGPHGAEIPVDPANHGLVDDVCRDDVEVGSRKLGANNGGNRVVLDENLRQGQTATWKRSAERRQEPTMSSSILMYMLPSSMMS